MAPLEFAASDDGTLSFAGMAPCDGLTCAAQERDGEEIYLAALRSALAFCNRHPGLTSNDAFFLAAPFQ